MAHLQFLFCLGKPCFGSRPDSGNLEFRRFHHRRRQTRSILNFLDFVLPRDLSRRLCVLRPRLPRSLRMVRCATDDTTTPPHALGGEVLGRRVSLRLSTSAMRTIEKHGGLDSFLMQARNAELADEARQLKREIKAAQAAD